MKQRPRIYYTEADKALMWDLCSHTISLAALFSRQVVPLAPSAGGMRDCTQIRCLAEVIRRCRVLR